MNDMTIFKEIHVFSQKIGRWSAYCLLHVDAARFTDISFCVVSQSFWSIKFRFFWDDYVKKNTGMLIGPSPELEMALFTLCYLFRPDGDCIVSLAGDSFIIRTGIDHGTKELRSAFFVLRADNITTG